MENTINELHTLGDFIRWGASQFNKAKLFFGHGTDNAIDEAIALVFYALYLPQDIPEILWHARLTYSEKQRVLELLNRRIQERIPTPYLTSQSWFANLRFYVDQRVLIPRSPMAELIEQRFEPWVEADRVRRMLDLCTGSGCIAIASAMLAFPYAEIDAADVSQTALEVAQRNIKHYGLENRVHAVHSNLFSNLADIRYDLIVCNPPYADAREIETMPDEYHYEPLMGLEAGKDGLFFVKEILREATKHLTPDGAIIIEVGLSQTSLIEQYPELPFMWLEFRRGGEGVFLITAKQLCDYAEILEERGKEESETSKRVEEVVE
ncbi:50S ribosomal protein L3 N(5)-glutamine methyltransferase [Candidatus Parabeggiatoa sp. HSG14]|uniref:50S ribosomal protein L3 N(5)-glutamine methyltransferase n=1 Tax=Candidatus Parabeggiatoa sp. HSG14 TaxID=3055593 RepID=UPI0025A763D9|nr:50S ribosomal protein L3 N(5)-glutamine methyltransferase [Thiotrichales bacterium HSG14]